MKEDNFIAGPEAFERMIRGADKVADAVRGTLGAAGYNFLAEHTLPPYAMTSNDGVTLARAIRLADKFEQLGASVFQEIAGRADKVANDGTTAAVTLAQAIVHEGMEVDEHPMALKRSLEECIPLIEKILARKAKHIETKEVGAVASIAAEDTSIGGMIREIYEKIGRDGIIFHDAAQMKDSYTLDRGARIEDCGLASPLMADITESMQLTNVAQRKNIPIAVVHEKISSINQLQPLGAALTSMGEKQVAFFVDEYDPLVIIDLLTTRRKGGVDAILLKMPILWKDWWFEDIAQLTGATVISPSLGTSLASFKKEHFGRAGYLVSEVPLNSKTDPVTFLDGTRDVSAYCAKLMEEGSDDSRLRAARLNKKTAHYHIGALTEQALAYRRGKVVDALGTAYNALHGGVVAGGGVALRDCARSLSDSTVGKRILKKALLAPYMQILHNAGIKDDSALPDGWGFDAISGKKKNMVKNDIIDAHTTVLSSFRSAISAASTLLTARVLTVLPDEAEGNINPFNPYVRN